MAVKPLVSVIIPTFNRLGFLKEAVESVEKQSCRDFELIIVDDGSTDSTGGYLKGFPAKYIRLEHSGFPGRVRNAGAKAAEGKYLAFLDSDDLWEPEKLARQIEYLAANPKIEICHTRELLILADCGGANGYWSRVWKYRQLCEPYNLMATIPLVKKRAVA